MHSITQKRSIPTKKYRKLVAGLVAGIKVTLTVCCDWMRHTETMGSHFNVMVCCTVYVSTH
jgi:hypothetical protein